MLKDKISKEDFVKYIEKIDKIDYERIENENFAYRI